jgi:hypothetical protein
MKYILIWVVTSTGGISAGEMTSGSAEFGSYEACHAAGRHMSSATGHRWQWNCVPYELEPGQTSLTEKQDGEAR